MSLRAHIEQLFQREFGHAPSQWFSAPGRVNLIGEHTDYNDGFVLPCAIQFETMLAARLVPDCTQIRIYAADYQQMHVIDLAKPITPVASPRWANYARGVVAGLQQHLQQQGRTLPGCQLMVAGDVPQGAGLSSSASLEMVLGLGLSSLAGAPVTATENAKIGQQAEHQFAGCQCGIMDQLVSAAGVAGHALLLDCRSLDYQMIAMPTTLQVLIIHSNVKRGLVDSAYNERRQQCEAAAAFFGVKALRDVSLPMLDAAKSALDPIIYARARHVISENERTLAAANALQHGDIQTLSQLMAQSHQSMRDDFAITVPAIDFLVAEVAAHCGTRGGVRMTGGGFGGCVVALLPADLVEPICQHLSRVYPIAHQLTPTFYLCQANAGARQR